MLQSPFPCNGQKCCLLKMAVLAHVHYGCGSYVHTTSLHMAWHQEKIGGCLAYHCGNCSISFKKNNFFLMVKYILNFG